MTALDENVVGCRSLLYEKGRGWRLLKPRVSTENHDWFQYQLSTLISNFSWQNRLFLKNYIKKV